MTSKSLLKSIEIVIFSALFFLGLLFSIFSPPFQKPDEQTHFRKAVSLSKGYVFCSEKNLNFPLERQFQDILTDPMISSVAYHKEVKFPSHLYKGQLFANASENKTSIDSGWDLCILPPFAYVPQTIGLLVARIVNLSAIPAFFLGRLFVFLTAFAWLILIFKRTPHPYRWFLLFAYSLPMTLHQVTSYSYDGVHIMLGLTLFAQLTSLLTQSKASRRSLAIYTITLILFILSKSGYELLSLTLIAIPRRHISANPLKYWLYLFLSFLSIGAAFLLFRYGAYVLLTSHTYPAFIYPSLQLKNILTYPFDFLGMLVRTTWIQKKFYFQSLVGLLGWLDYSLDKSLYLLYAVIAIYLVGIKVKKPTYITFWSLCHITIPIIGIYIFILFSYYLIWVPVGSDLSGGIQGRYFIVLVPFTLFLLSSIWNDLRYRTALFMTIVVFISASLTHTVWLRYFDYSQLIENRALLDTTSQDMSPRRIEKGALFSYKLISPKSKKIAGTIVFFAPSKVTKPIIAELRTADCKIALEHRFIDLSHYSNSPYQILWQKTKIGVPYCLTIRQFDDKKPEDFSIYQRNGVPLIRTLYYR